MDARQLLIVVEIIGMSQACSSGNQRRFASKARGRRRQRTIRQIGSRGAFAPKKARTHFRQRADGEKDGLPVPVASDRGKPAFLGRANLAFVGVTNGRLRLGRSNAGQRAQIH